MVYSLKICFATTNKHKLEEARKILAGYGIDLEMVPEKKREIQSEKLEEIAEVAALEIAESLGIRVVTEDSGLFIQALNNFPGPYSAYTHDTIGCEGILDLMRNKTNRRAKFRAVVAYCESTQMPRSFIGIVEGNIAPKARGIQGFGFDPIFVPTEGDGRTFAQMTQQEKNQYSHRARAFRNFGEWFQEYQRSLK